MDAILAEVASATQEYQATPPGKQGLCPFDSVTNPVRTALNGSRPPGAEGAWHFSDMTIVRASIAGDTNGQRVEGTITFANQTADGTIEQVNTGGVSAGSGEGYVSGTDASNGVRAVRIVQRNNAVGAGCTQKVDNVIDFYRTDILPAGTWQTCVLTVVLQSSCGGLGWRVSAGMSQH